MLDVERLSRKYGERDAVSDLSFEARPGEILGLVGPNGAGKTTTLRCIAGILLPTAGRIRIGGHDLLDEPLEAKRRLAFVPDEPFLFDYLTVEEHLLFTGRLRGVEHGPERGRALLEELELAGRERSLPSELSRGMRQKLAIACALLHEPGLILFDEPLTGLDPVGIRRMKDSIAARAAAGACVVVSSHLLHLVEELCQRILILKGGRRIALGTLAEIQAAAPRLEAEASLEAIFLRMTQDDPRM
jgi:ABC-2 type transport system ATP-binding protein